MVMQRRAELTPENQDNLNSVLEKKRRLVNDIDRYQKDLEVVESEMAALEAEGVYDDVEDEERSRRLREDAIKRFNAEPEKGVEFLMRSRIVSVPYDAEAIAKFLHDEPRINKQKLGDYLGDGKPFQAKVLEEFSRLHDFRNMLIIHALRQFLSSFRLPGESQKIQRILENFSQRYVEMNANQFQDKESCFLLSYLIIMLHTSLHNPQVRERDRMTVEIFVQRVNDAIKDNLSREFLESVFDTVKRDPFKMTDDGELDRAEIFSNAERKGWLFKEGNGQIRSWHRRYFVLKDSCLYYFLSDQDKDPKGIISMEGLDVRPTENSTRQHCFEIFSKLNQEIKICKLDEKNGKTIYGKHHSYRLSASTPREKMDWIESLRKATVCPIQARFPSRCNLRKSKSDRKLTFQ